jgi:hypothetical protein
VQILTVTVQTDIGSAADVGLFLNITQEISLPFEAQILLKNIFSQKRLLLQHAADNLRIHMKIFLLLYTLPCIE